MSKTPRVAAYATMNLSQLSEFMLVICSLGVVNGHIDEETLEIAIMAFAILAVVTSYMLKYKHFLFSKTATLVNAILGRPPAIEHGGLEEDDEGEDREIVLLGFHKIAFLLIGEVQTKSPELMTKFHVIDVNTNIMPKLREMGIKCTYGDIASSAVMKHARRGMKEPRIVMSTIPDALLQGITNLGMVQTLKNVWPEAHIIAIADDPHTAKQLYNAGASYVVRMAKLSAERLLSLLNSHDKSEDVHDSSSSVIDLIKQFKAEDNASKGNFAAQHLKF